MNSKKPPQPQPEELRQAPDQGPQALPQEEALTDTGAEGLRDPDDQMKRIEREGEINKVSPEPEKNIGPDTTGVGQPALQPVNRGQSLPPAAIPVEKKFEGRSDQFYDPNASEVASQEKDRANRGGQKAEF